MKFYNREKEIEELKSIQISSHTTAKMSVVTGRRRIGKTQLLLKATENQPTLYFFVARKSESLLCQDFILEIKNKLNLPILGEINSFGRLFEYLMQISKGTPFNLIIDEFQEFFNINPSVYSDIQHYWDINKDESRINLLLSGSIYSLMNKIFLNNKEPLFNRHTTMLRVKPFKTDIIKEILSDYNPKHNKEDVLALYSLTGGIAKYIQLLMDNKATTKDKMIDLIVKEDSVFLSEGKNILIEEFGKEYAIYFTILSLIAAGDNTRSKIESVIKKEIGGYLTRLENDYNLIIKRVPILSKAESKSVRYELNDNFFTFWFRFIFKYDYLLQIEQFDILKDIIKRDYSTFTGRSLEKYFYVRFIEEKKYTRLGGFWDRKGENEIDLIGINEIIKSIDFYEIKRNKTKIDLGKLREKSQYFLSQNKEFKDYKIEIKALSIEDI